MSWSSLRSVRSLATWLPAPSGRPGWRCHEIPAARRRLQERFVELDLLQHGILPDDGILDRAPADPAALLDRYVGTDLTLFDRHSIFDVHRVMNGHAGKLTPAGGALAQQDLV